MAKIVGESEDYDSARRQRTSCTRSSTVTHPDDNRGSVDKSLSARFGIASSEIATTGNKLNDVVMFDGSGLSIAMGTKAAGSSRPDSRVTSSNDDDGFANAVGH